MGVKDPQPALNRALCVLACLAFWAVPVQAATKLWAGTDANWFNNNNWSPVNRPVAGDDVTIDPSATITNVLLTNSTPMLSSFMITNASLTFTNWWTTLNATNVLIRNGGLLTHWVCDTNAALANSNRVSILCSNFTMEVGGAINVDGKGYPGSPGAGGHPWNGQGPGGGVEWAAQSYGNGGGYGGEGGFSYDMEFLNTNFVSTVYGASNAPVQPGSGGGGQYGGNGGGVVRIEAGKTAEIRGAITASGGAATTYGGGGSGGGIYITCARLTGDTNGLLSVNAGDGAPGAGGGGGGGRITVVYTPAIQATQALPRIRCAAAGGLGGIASTWAYHPGWNGGLGTIYFPDTSVFLTNTLNNGLFQKGILLVPGFTAWAPNSLGITNCDITFGANGFLLRVTNDIAIGSGGRLALHLENSRLDCANLILTNGGALALYSGGTNGTTDYGALLSVTNAMAIGANSSLALYSEPTNGGSLLLRVSNLIVQAGGILDANGKGYSGGTNHWNMTGYKDGYGPGHGYNYAAYGTGGGYGGEGGMIYDGERSGRYAYGSSNAPLDPGSGSGGMMGGAGGGLVRVEASGVVAVFGAIAANGTNGTSWGGGGSGGGVYIRCLRLDGDSNGLVSADGGSPSLGTPYGSGPGGGGRIAVIYDPAAQTGNPGVRFSARQGAITGTFPSGLPAFPGEMGTIYFTNAVMLSSPVRNVSGLLYIPGFTNWAPNSLTVDGCFPMFEPAGFQLTVTSDVTVCNNGSLGITPSSTLSCGGNLVLTNGAALNVYGGMTATSTAYGALINVGGDMSIGPGCWVYPYAQPTNGGTPVFRMNNLSIASNAGFNANGAGYSGGTNLYAFPGYKDGYGPGRGADSQGYGSGGGYGGRGGDAYLGVVGGVTNGLAMAPMTAGSGSGGEFGGNGGGPIRIEANGTVALDGTMTANGSSPTFLWGGGGSGGGIYLVCQRFTGGSNSLLSACGGQASVLTYGGGGGGGRIAVWSGVDRGRIDRSIAGENIASIASGTNYSGFWGALYVTNGQGFYTGYTGAAPGTALFFWSIAPRGTIYRVR